MTEQNDFEEAQKYSSATLHEASGKRGALPSAIKPISPTFTIYGPAFPVLSPPKDNLWLHRAIYEAKPGDVLVVDVGEYYEAGYWGEIMATAAVVKQIAGIVINGGVRDCKRLVEMGFPTFSRGLCIQGTGKDKKAYGHINQPIRIGEVNISPGDLVYGDQDGVVVLPKERIKEVLIEAKKREDDEAELLNRIRAGESTLDIYNLR
ncbi:MULTISPECIES: 4-carboxy-4-hydroxy-2-oxoadipate aldolase/oxaloacetate decarboxylase [unclassified Paenibacillus]|uniref:4-carboxy-4-hydroxy-2-oxoadipate aldolase/oxaloacetate decarboxylase n=1 Tax=unclassified Paenibacillus TaxID=185978 RepID=UPI001AE20272|nr:MULTISPECIES: 4-carboxy-4-hydroxy-2-oxoadipate aldolase/oxaloacetate decarboxylase [unclassified Paenibacillus]MBP1155411.1 4-hydroxy-4-methyl-2-oxoglutarate aldolase [Paenibacillus sp. PvP091]MBP1169204.1 4-hydroxy-4-methyl-2-oxoglutarate aldolase [Paenibacillus sp. PvR098]MBP2440232.1 4-hydroxy-4-methyl-2-oxoglutarate aldolase [Paenibacillus sp. PvP052]